MKKLIILFIAFLFISCDDGTVTVNKEYYQSLVTKVDSVEKVKVKTREDSIYPFTIRQIGNHQFLEFDDNDNSSSHVYSFTHDPECHCYNK